MMSFGAQRYFGEPDHRLLELGTGERVLQPIQGRIPALVIDNFFAHAKELRAAALKLAFRPVPGTYPGRQAHAPRGDEELQHFQSSALATVREEYLPVLNAYLETPVQVSQIRSDFAVVDVHPSDLTEDQRAPHADPVPIFGLVYLSLPPRGGTLFFEEVIGTDDPGLAEGYFTQGNQRWKLTGRIEGAFNRAVFYPGTLYHSGDISGKWIESDERYRYPRLTLRMLFS